MKKFIHVFLICLILSGFYTGCKTFDPNDYIVAGQPDECNDFYIVIAAYYKNDQKDFAFPALMWQECKTARAKKQK
jgi:outer membrane PBP1 activator LpoA protein